MATSVHWLLRYHCYKCSSTRVFGDSFQFWVSTVYFWRKPTREFQKARILRSKPQKKKWLKWVSKRLKNVSEPQCKTINADNWLLQSLVLTCCMLMAILLTLAASSGSAAHKGHVHINVWRGPSKGHKKHKFAPWGYYAKLPADESKKKHHHHYGWWAFPSVSHFEERKDPISSHVLISVYSCRFLDRE